MKSHLLLLSLLVSFGKHYGQPTTIVTKDKETSYEEYYVLESDKKIKHGSYVKLDKLLIGGYAFEAIGSYSNGVKEGYWETYYENNNNIKEKGFYKNGQRDSVWVLFYAEGVSRNLEQQQNENGASLQIVDANPVVWTTGKYANGKAIGTWEYFDERGVLYQIFDHDKASLTFLKNSDLKNVDAGFIGGENLLTKHLYESFDFKDVMNSVDTKIRLQSGKVVFEFIIDEKGSVRDIVELESTINSKKLRARALEVTHGLDHKWYPKVVDGQRQPTKKKIIFDLAVDSKYSIALPNDKFGVSTGTKGFVLKMSVE